MLGLLGMTLGLSLSIVGGIYFGLWMVDGLTDGKLKELFK